MAESETRKYGLWQNVVLGLAFMAPALSFLATFSLVLAAGFSWIAIPLDYLIAGIAATITAVSFAELVKAYPKSGSIWNFAEDTVGPKFGQFSVWIYLLELIVAPAAALIPVGFFAWYWLGISPWIIVLIFAVVVMLLSIFGAVLSIRTMAILFIIEIAILFVFAGSSIAWSIDSGAYEVIATLAFTPSGSLFGFAGIMVGATVAIFSYIGYESSATMAEETKEPTRNIPRAIILSAVIGTLIYTFLAWAFVLAIPTRGLFNLQHFFNPVPYMAEVIWGGGMANLLNLAGILAGITSALAAVTAGSRLIQKLGEDNILPTAFSKTRTKYITPLVSILFVSLVTVLLAGFAPWEVVVYILATGAIPAFIITNFLAFWHYRKDGWGIKNIVVHGLIPFAGIVLLSWFALVGLPFRMQFILLIWLVLGAFLVFVNACFRPRVFSRGAEMGTKPSVPRVHWLGLVVSLIALVVVLVGFGFWYNYFSGIILWWHILAPFASVDLLATAATVAVAGVLFVGMAYGILKGNKEVQ
ncbi:MAG: APC family permease [Candidatus Thorarchaeota archaeon]|jgi:putrescine importer